MSASAIKANYAVVSRHEAFYTGGRVQFSKNGDHIFCGCGNKVQVITVNNGQLLHSIGKEDDPDVTSFIVSPDDQYLMIANRQLLLLQYNWRTSDVVRKWRAIHTAPVTCMDFDVSSTLLATGGADQTVKVWDIVKQYCTHNLRGHTGVISNILFHPDLELLQLFSSADDYQIRRWDLRQSVCLHVFTGHYSAISSLQITPDGATLVSGGRDNVVLCWNLSDQTKKTIPVYESIESVLVLESSRSYPQFNIEQTEDLHVITAGEKGALKVWNTRSGHCAYTRPITRLVTDDVTESEAEVDGATSHVSQMMFVPSLEALCVVTFQHNIIVYRLSDLTVHRQFAGYNDDILDVKLFGQDERRLAVATNSEQLKIFDVETWHCDIVYGHTDIVMSVDVYKNSQIIVTGSKDKTIRVWRVVDDELVCAAVGRGHSKAINSVAMSRYRPDFCVSAGEDHTLKLWQMSDAINSSSSSGPRMRTIHAHLTEPAHDKDINSVDVAPNDRFIVTGSQDKTAKLWKSDDLSLVGVFRGHKRGIWSVAFSPVDQAIGTASADSTIRIWSITDFTCVRTFEGHQNSVLKLVFVSRGMQIVSSDSDGLVKLWTIKTNECARTFDEHDQKIWALCRSRDDCRIVTGGADSNILVWNDVTEEEIRQKQAERDDFIVKEQKLLNLLQQKKYVKAIALAITLEQPQRLLNILQTVLAMEDGTTELNNVLIKLRPDQMGSLLRFAVNWNTNTKYSYEAQTLINLVLKAFTPEQILEFPEIKSIVEGFLPYSERHFQRLSRLQQQASFVDYTVKCMKFVSNLGTSAESTEADELPRPLAAESFIIDKTGRLGSHQASQKDTDKDSCENDDDGSTSDDVSANSDDVSAKHDDDHSDSSDDAFEKNETGKTAKEIDNIQPKHKRLKVG